ncbi:uncharacterized protein K452DRAFT_48600 [Aplosporella prunicola CBS 121167]|uniref:Ig-like domain-containing protein n=1 Tax=Aplosporella prunicola CBS 121167 TaxID=1176127 RepID=A0A6A6BAH2_9PEZI|nr:uncharacterized protein K452DRAFT_48600 [Aplosporella prunicola CBS 121167]KAF2140588.1 hypothetical protein K452DRAFT_48600 [Aplosporella prunicola CBS 121167]
MQPTHLLTALLGLTASLSLPGASAFRSTRFPPKPRLRNRLAHRVTAKPVPTTIAGMTARPGAVARVVAPTATATTAMSSVKGPITKPVTVPYSCGPAGCVLNVQAKTRTQEGEGNRWVAAAATAAAVTVTVTDIVTVTVTATAAYEGDGNRGCWTDGLWVIFFKPMIFLNAILVAMNLLL